MPHPEYKHGWNNCIKHLMQGGSQIGSDIRDVDGRLLGRFHAFFPAGCDAETRAQHYRAMADMEIATKDAVPLNFGDLKWIESENKDGIR